jgi:hypothetical protein
MMYKYLGPHQYMLNTSYLDPDIDYNSYMSHSYTGIQEDMQVDTDWEKIQEHSAT